jgi:hypothetical protein
MLTAEIEGGGDRHTFVVDTGAIVSSMQPGISKAQMQPCDIKARGVTGTHLDILGEQDVEFTLRSCNNEDIKFRHIFVVSPLKRCSSGIFGMVFLQRVGARNSLTSQSLFGAATLFR